MWHGSIDVTLFAKLQIYFGYTKLLRSKGIILDCFYENRTLKN